MPPKKTTKQATANANTNATEPTTFRWTLENERKLLYLTQGRALTREHYEDIAAFFPGTTKHGVEVRVSKFRVEQRKLLEKIGWTDDVGVQTKTRGGSKAGKTAGKRAAQGGEEEVGVPRKRRETKVKVVEKDRDQTDKEESGKDEVVEEKDEVEA